MIRLRFFLLPAGCFILAWGATHLFRTMASVGDPVPPRRVSIPARTAPPVSRRDTVHAACEAFAKAVPGEWSALWQEFAAGASLTDLEKAARTAVPVLPQLSAEELAVRTGKASGPTGTFAALAVHDPEAAWQQARQTGERNCTAAVLRVLAQRNPAGALQRALKLPEGRPITVDEAYSLGRTGETVTPLGEVLAAWTRRDPQAAVAAVESLRSKGERHAARRTIAVQWAYRDGPAALEFVMQHAPRGEKLANSFRMDYILRAAFSSDPAGTAKLMSEHAALRAALGHEGPQLSALKPWHRADPQGALAWLRDSGPVEDSRAAMWLISYVVSDNPRAAAPLIREFPRAGHPDHTRNIAAIARQDPSMGLTLADDLGLRPQVEAALRTAEIKSNPAAACDRWLEAVKQHGAQGALTALGWTSQTALELAAFVCHAMPERARALADVVPASVLMPERRYLGSEQAAAKFWPELQPEVKPAAVPSPVATEEPADSPDEEEPPSFTANPAAAAQALMNGPLLPAEVQKAVNCWAPHDFAAASAWVAQLPDGPARHQGELALATEQAPRDPAAALQCITTLPNVPPQEVTQLWTTCLQRLVLIGGDWQGWLAKAPAEVKKNSNMYGQTMEQVLTEEARLLTALRKSAGK